jgi:hypothetical protein
MFYMLTEFLFKMGFAPIRVKLEKRGTHRKSIIIFRNIELYESTFTGCRVVNWIRRRDSRTDNAMLRSAFLGLFISKEPDILKLPL